MRRTPVAGGRFNSGLEDTMVGHIGQDKHQRRQVFRQITPPGMKPISNGRGGFDFIPHRASTRDAAPPPAPTKPSTIGAAYEQTHTLAKAVNLMADVARRIAALEANRSAQRQLAEQQQPTTQPNHQPTPTPTRDAPCACRHVLAPQPTRDGVTTMPRNPAPTRPYFQDELNQLSRDPNLAPARHLSFAPPHAHATRDQQQLQYGEKPPSRFTSEAADKMARYLPPGSASRVTTKEAVNDMNLRSLSQRDATQPHNISGPPQPAMTQGSDLSSAFASTLNAIPSGQPQAALNAYHRAFHAAKTSDARDAIDKVWRAHQSSYDARGGNPFAPRQPAHDAPWSSLYEANKGTIGGDPNKLQVGQTLNLPGGGTHTVAKGETLSGIASTPAGTDLGSKSLAAERGGVEPTGGNYSSGGSLKVFEGGGSVPTPSSRPSEFGGSAQAAEPSSSSSSSGTPMPPTKPASLGGTGESLSGLNPQAGEGGGASPTGSEGTGLAKFVRGLVGEE